MNDCKLQLQAALLTIKHPGKACIPAKQAHWMKLGDGAANRIQLALLTVKNAQGPSQPSNLEVHLKGWEACEACICDEGC